MVSGHDEIEEHLGIEGIGKSPVNLIGLLLRRGERLREFRIDDVETQPGELFDTTGKVTFLSIR